MNHALMNQQGLQITVFLVWTIFIRLSEKSISNVRTAVVKDGITDHCVSLLGLH